MIEKLRELKKKSHMTNQQIAEKSNIPESTVARIFSGKTPNPTVATVVSMARAMGGSVADLLTEEDGLIAEDYVTDKQDGLNADKGNEEAVAAGAGTFSDAGNGSGADPGQGLSSPQGLPTLENNISQGQILEDIINLYKNELKKKDIWLARLFWCLAGIVMFILFVLVFDILHPNFGFVKY